MKYDSTAEMKVFPIMSSVFFKAIPWSALAPHEDQAIKNHGQTLQRLADRGGLCPDEAIWIIRGEAWSTSHVLNADALLAQLVWPAGRS